MPTRKSTGNCFAVNVIIVVACGAKLPVSCLSVKEKGGGENNEDSVCGDWW